MRYLTLDRAIAAAEDMAHRGMGRCFVIPLGDGTYTVGRFGDRRPHVYATK